MSYYSNTPISQPNYDPDNEIVGFDGFAWSTVNGIVLQYNTNVPINLQPMDYLRD